LADAEGEGLSSRFFVGTMGWSYGFWKSVFYPEDLPSSKFLNFYAKKFNSVEVDSTFYRIPRETTIVDWQKQVSERFVFSLKFPQKITHIKMLEGCEEETRVFLERVAFLKEKLGVLLLQLPPAFNSEHFSSLDYYLKSLPKKFRYSVEVRNKSLLNQEVYDLLRNYNVALAWVDSAKMPLSSESTSDFVYIRWEGNRKKVRGTIGKSEIDRKENINSWAKKLKPILEEKIIYGYFSKYYSGFPPQDCAYLLKEIQKR
jgi:uncharacterized protein YecE (DUF72 family)